MNRIEEGLDVSFCIITNGKRPQMLSAALKSIHNLRVPSYELIVSGSAPQDLDTNVEVLDMREAALSGDLGAMRNAAVDRARSELVVISDDDMFFDPNFFSAIKAKIETYDLLAVAVENPDGSRYWDWAEYNPPHVHQKIPYGTPSPYIYITGGILVGRRSAITKVRWSEGRGIDQNEDVDFSTRAKSAGFLIGSCPQAKVLHSDKKYCGKKDIVRALHDPWRYQEISPRLLARGIYPQRGKSISKVDRYAAFRIIGTQAGGELSFSFQVNALLISEGKKFSLRISAYFLNEIFAEFDAQCPVQSFRIPIPSGLEVATIVLESSSGVSVVLHGNFNDQVASAGILGNLQFVSQSTGFQEDSHAEYEQWHLYSPRPVGIHVEAPLFASSTRSLLGNGLVELLSSHSLHCSVSTDFGNDTELDSVFTNVSQKRAYEEAFSQPKCLGTFFYVPEEDATWSDISHCRVLSRDEPRACLFLPPSPDSYCLSWVATALSFDRIIVSTDTQMREFLDSGIAASRMMRMPLGLMVPPSLLSQKESKRPLTNSLVVSIISDLNNCFWKELIEAFSVAVCRGCQSTMLLLCRTESVKEALTDFIDEVSGNIEINIASQCSTFSPLSNALISPVLREAALLVDCQKDGADPASVAMALFHGVPILARNNSQSMDLLNGHIELLYDVGSDSKQLIAERLVALLQEPRRLEHIGESLKREREEEFSSHTLKRFLADI
jgi:hypothetical protein